jgi:hypothetical protein
MDILNLVGAIGFRLLFLNMMPLALATGVFSVERKGLRPIATASVVGVVVSSLVWLVLSPTGTVGALIALFALAGVYALVLEVPLGRAAEIALIVIVVQLVLIVGAIHIGFTQYLPH